MAYWVAIAAVIAGGATAIGGGLQAKSTREAGAEARTLAEQDREDRLMQFEIGTGLKREELRLRREGQESSDYFSQAQLRHARRQQDFLEGQTNLKNINSHYDRVLQLINSDVGLKNSLIAKVRRSRQGGNYAI